MATRKLLTTLPRQITAATTSKFSRSTCLPIHWKKASTLTKTRLVEPKDVEGVSDFLRSSLSEDPLFAACGLNGRIVDNGLINHFVEKLHEGNSLLVETADKKIIGVAINSKVTPEECQKFRNFERSTMSEPTRALCSAWAYIENLPSVWDKSRLRTACNMRLILHPDYRDKSIYRPLALQSRTVARSMGYPAIRSVCTHPREADAIHSLGFRCVSKIPLEQCTPLNKMNNGKPKLKRFYKVDDDLVKVYLDSFGG